MTALVRYSLATVLHSQRYLAPVLLFLAALAVGTSNGSGPIVPSYALCAAALFICSAWFTVTLLNLDDPISRAITVVNAGRSRSVLIAAVIAASLGSLLMAVVGLVFPLLTGDHQVSGTDLVVGAEAEVCCALTGIAVGLVCSRLVIRRPGYSLLAALALVMIMLLVRGLPPVNPMFRLMSGDTPPADLVGPITGYTAVALALLLACAAVTQYVATRHD